MDAPVTAEQFKLGMRALAGAVTLLTSDDGRRCGMTATAVCSVSADPPTVLVCVNRNTSTYAAIEASRVFCVNVLRSEERELPAAFSGRAKGEARFHDRQWMRLATGAPVLVGALVAFDCRVMKQLDHGTHTVFLGEVAAIRRGARGEALLYADGQYARLASAQGEPLPEGMDWGWGG